MKDINPYVRITVPGRPIPKGRPRFSKGRAYTPARTAKHEKLIRDEAMVQMFGKDILTCPVEVFMDFYFPINKTYSKKKQKEMMEGGYSLTSDKEPVHCMKKVDLDNLEKLANDALNGVVFEDDQQIVMLSAWKHWAYPDEGRTIIEVHRIYQ